MLSVGRLALGVCCLSQSVNCQSGSNWSRPTTLRIADGTSSPTEGLHAHVHRLAGAAGLNLDDRLRRSRPVQSDRRARGGDRQGDRNCTFFLAHKGKQPSFASCSRSRRNLAAVPDFPYAWRLLYPWLGAFESLNARYTNFQSEAQNNLASLM